MKLPNETLSVDEEIEEFDQWLTPQLQSIKDTDKFSTELENIATIIDDLGLVLNSFSNISDCSIEKIRDGILVIISGKISSMSIAKAEIKMYQMLTSFFSVLFLVTGSTDNNLKNHFTIKLKQDGVDTHFPEKTGRINISYKLKKFGNTISSSELSKKLSRAYIGSKDLDTSVKVTIESGIILENYVQLFLLKYIALILSAPDDIRQFWIICKSYCDIKKTDKKSAICLLNPITIFKIRGSVSASAGHLPEVILRNKLKALGLEPGVDFNTSDVVIGEENVLEKGEVKSKNRAYDFVLPYMTDNWEHQLFIQAQFYAGDSGSVSHKVIDQTVSSRQYTISKYPNAKFVEYLDGAGYFAALRTDLRHMLRMANTHSFFQVRSIWVRLRRELQAIGFITPLEIEHAILRTPSGDIDNVKSILLTEGYHLNEVERGISYAVKKRIILDNTTTLKISPSRKNLTRRLMVLDIIANNGKKMINRDDINKSILIPGYGVSYGINFVVLGSKVENAIKYETISLTEYNKDIEWLMDEKVIKRLNL